MTSNPGFDVISIDFNQMSSFSHMSDETHVSKFSIRLRRSLQRGGLKRALRGFVAGTYVTCVLNPHYSPTARAFCGRTARKHCVVTSQQLISCACVISGHGRRHSNRYSNSGHGRRRRGDRFLSPCGTPPLGLQTVIDVISFRFAGYTHYFGRMTGLQRP